MERVIFANTWEKFFSEAGLLSFEDFFYYATDSLIGKNEKREVITFHAGKETEGRQFFLKRFIKPHFKDIFFTWRGTGRLCSQGKYEWDCANFLIQNGIESYKPVCYGEQIKLGLERRSFFVTEKLPGECMTDFVKEQWPNLERHEKETIIRELGLFVRKIHDLKVSFPDLYLWHIFLRQEEGQWEFAIIDLHRMIYNVFKTNEQIKNLGRF
ncbi:MAG: lipopolysaccharide kinase InaA family protein, partial [Planctomycetota bacterium]